MKSHGLFLSTALALAFAIGAASGCNAPADELTGLAGREADVTADPDEEKELAAQVPPSTPLMRNLSNREYIVAASDLIGVALPLDLVKDWTPTTQFSGFDAIPWTNFDAKAVRDRAATLDRILSEATKSPKVMTCSVSSPEELAYEGCAKQILEPVAKRAFGRPLLEPELASLVASYDTSIELAKSANIPLNEAFVDAISTALGTILLSPQFVTLIERPPTAEFVGERELNAYELAHRVSFLFLGSIPDDELWRTAEDGSLSASVDVLTEQVSRLLLTRTDTFVQNFMGQWLDFRSYDSTEPGSLEHAMWQETWRTLVEVVQSDLPITALVKPGFSFLNEQLATHYGIEGTFSAELEKRPTEERGGILQQGSWLTLSASPLGTSPIHRGRLVQDRLLCKVVPPPDQALFEQIQDVSASIPENATVKERLDIHREAGPACAGCHQYMDPIGLGLEGFDQRGQRRTKYPDTGYPVETASDILGKPFSNAEELNHLLTTMPEYRTCVSEKVAVFGLRTIVDQSASGDAALLRYLSHQTANEAPTFREIVLRLVTSNAFRKVIHGGGG